MLPRIFEKLRIATAASQVYSSMPQLASLLQCLAAQLAKRSNDEVSSGGKIWDQPSRSLVPKLKTVLALHKAFEVH